MSRYFKYLLLGTFFAAVLIIVYLYFNSNRSINELMSGNENLLEELSVKNNLQDLRAGLAILDSRTRGQIISGKPAKAEDFDTEIHQIKTALSALDTLQSEPLIFSALSNLRTVVQESILFNQRVLDTFRTRGKAEAENLINTRKGKKLTDSINRIAENIDSLHQRSVTELILQADANVNRARTTGSILALIAAVASIFTFIYIAYKVRSQEQLIGRLNASEKKEKETARIKENFLANMSHEIRTPLNAILGFTSLLSKEPLDPTARHYVQTISHSGDHLLNIVNEILDLSRIEAGMMRIENTSFDLRQLFSALRTMFGTQAAEKGLDISFEIDESIPVFITGDPVRLNQIMVNLIGNAIKFTDKGNIGVRVTNEGITGNIIQTGIRVADSGVGIEPEKLSRIFERFNQAESQASRRFGGTGLGLAIVQELVLLQHGQVEVKSQPGAGTVFQLRIPYQVDEKINSGIDGPVKKATQLITESGFRILVAEDNNINQQLIGILLSKRSIEFDLVNNGRGVLSQLRLRKYDMILMDIQMPEMDGYAATSAIRKDLNLAIPVIAMTAHALQGERDKCLVMGMNGYLSKPIREDELYKLIAEFSGKGESRYRIIDTHYLKEVSSGNLDFEKTVTEQFMDEIPGELVAIDQAWNAGDRESVRQFAHNMRTTVSIMGLNEKLAPFLDELETNWLSEQSYHTNFSQLRDTLNLALEEARTLYEQINLELDAKTDTIQP